MKIHNRRKNLTKEEREIQILQWFAECVRVDNWEASSLAQIGAGVGLSPSSYLRKFCEELVGHGVIIPVTLNRKGRWQGRGYRPSRKHFKKPERTVVFNFTQNGKKITMRQLL